MDRAELIASIPPAGSWPPKRELHRTLKFLLSLPLQGGRGT
jgi:hypothetical protein